MSIVQAMFSLLNEIKSEEFNDDVKKRAKEQIASAAAGLTSNPQDKNDSNIHLLNAMLVVVLGKVEELYGSADSKIYDTPLSLPQEEARSGSQIVPLKEDHGTVAVVLGSLVTSWENAFYDVCHESVHLLNPVINVQDASVKVSALDEGVAVKFAEQMYKRYIKPYCNQIPLTSPICAKNSQYFVAYSATKKIPDNVLKEVRKVFGMFSRIDDAKKFKRLVGLYLSDEEVDELSAKFVY